MINSGQDNKFTQPDHPHDCIGELQENYKVAGKTFSYDYPSGPTYRISFDETHVYFKTPALPDYPCVALKYRAKELREDQYLITWFGPGRIAYVGLVLDVREQRVDSAVCMPGSYEIFDRAHFKEYYENGENALYTPYEHIWKDATD